jgi:hypothetical protein
MWRIAAKVELNRSGSSSNRYRLYPLLGQPVSQNDPIQCPVSERESGQYFLLDVAMTVGSKKASYPYLVNKHTQVMERVTKTEAEEHVRRSWPRSKLSRKVGAP